MTDLEGISDKNWLAFLDAFGRETSDADRRSIVSSEHRAISKLISLFVQVGPFDGKARLSREITIARDDYGIIAYCYRDKEFIMPAWLKIIDLACTIAPWLREADAADGDWFMTLFTLDGTLHFPPIVASKL